MRTIALLTLLFLSGSLTSSALAQGKGGKASNPVSYKNVLWSGQLAQFSFEDLGERKVLGSKKMSFFASERIEMKFRIKIKPDGTVAYVRGPRCAANLLEYRKGGTSALYGYQFSPESGANADQWVSVLMVVGD